MHSTIFNFSNKLYDADVICEQMDGYVDYVDERTGDYQKKAFEEFVRVFDLTHENIDGDTVILTNDAIAKAIDYVADDPGGFWFLTNDYDSLMLQQYLIRLYVISNENQKKDIVLKLSQVFDYHCSLVVDDFTVNEICPYCDNVIKMKWNTDTFGFEIFCPHCGKKIMLCDDCMHNPDGKCECDFNENTHSCHRKEV